MNEADFACLRVRLDLGDSTLSKQMSTLARAVFVRVHKTGGGRSGKTWYSLTKSGKRAFADYRKTLRPIVDG